ncbi:hypothetical protein GN244_ATG14871 [Phytophthora infestans]|uniref:Apple domain-containing protein n=1 Tax=Phytophthora infestans TaxID=4787 RepID=A0A833SJM1_PHYIN|nr:hypothetical protein GN244_ATG14871 [Phytophthora infestans]KAF4142913.1 hypothetical protein GN958_ATG07899 [Phytophthora infestans]
MRRLSIGVEVLLLVFTALSMMLWGPGTVAQIGGISAAKSPVGLKQQTPSTADGAVENDDCTSLSGPFCAHTGSMTLYASYMTPISVQDLHQEGNEVIRRSMKLDESVSKRQGKRCFFQHFATSWMDSGGDAYDLTNQQVTSVDDCELLCCEHAECQSFTFWRGRTCYLRASSNTPRPNGDSFSGIRLT